MVHIPPRLKASESAIRTADLQRYTDGWIMSGEIGRHPERTIGNRRLNLKCLLWFLRREGYDPCGAIEMRALFFYLIRKPRCTRKQPLGGSLRRACRSISSGHFRRRGREGARVVETT
jgi:hypothetical protein